MSIDRSEAKRKFKEQSVAAGIFAVRCGQANAVWVGSSPNLGAVQNREWFTLRQGNHRNKELQALWNSQGEASFTLEILEELDDEVPALLRSDLLKRKKQEWIEQLEAHSIL